MSHGLEKLMQKPKPQVFNEGILQPFPFDDNTAGEEVSIEEFLDHALPGKAPLPKDSRGELAATHRSLSGNALALMMKKNQDYACESDLFRNFRYFGPLGVLVRLSDKLSRLRTFEERDTFSVTDESLRDTIEDAINYLVIYYCMKTEGK